MHEKQMHEESCYLTLTWAPQHLPSKSLIYRPYQLFMRRLRKHFRPNKIRFYMCGEYGAECKNCGAQEEQCRCGHYAAGLGRPHYHAIIFGVEFKDKYAWQRNIRGDSLYRSSSLEQLWPYGHVTIGDVTFESAAYVARYVMKKINGKNANQHYTETDRDTGEIIRKVPEFTKMSLKPGIGAGWLQKYLTDVYPHGKVVVNGAETNSPKYYDKQYAKLHPELARDLTERRIYEAYQRREDNTLARLAAKARVMEAKTKTQKRGLQ